MALLALLLLVLATSVLVLVAPILRLRESPYGSPWRGAVIQLLPLVIALVYLALFRSEPVAQVPAEPRPELGEAVMFAMVLQLVATPVALRGSVVTPAARAIYAVLSAGGVLGVVLLVGWFTR